MPIGMHIMKNKLHLLHSIELFIGFNLIYWTFILFEGFYFRKMSIFFLKGLFFRGILGKYLQADLYGWIGVYKVGGWR